MRAAPQQIAVALLEMSLWHASLLLLLLLVITAAQEYMSGSVR
jgi:hypothetical protein